MGFPKYKRKYLFFKKTDGWEDIGEFNSSYKIVDGEIVCLSQAHAFCNDTLRIGKENGELFKFCHRCLVKDKR